MPYYQYKIENRLADGANDRNKDTSHARLLTKTPSVENLDQFFHYFPTAYLVILIRDGRSVVYSMMNSFDWDFEFAVHRWVKAAEIICEFDFKNKGKNNNYIIVKYENLFTDRENELRKLMNFLNLDPEKYDFDQVIHLPVYGSSEIKKTEGWIHWNAIKQNDNFEPLKRWEDWDKKLHNRFNWIAAEAMNKLGYPVETTKVFSCVEKIRHRWKDFKFKEKNKKESIGKGPG